MKEEGKEKIKRLALKSMKMPLRAMPRWMEAIGVGVFISEFLRKYPSFKSKLGGINDKLFLFEATDIKKAFYLHVLDNDIKVSLHSSRTPDVSMKGSFGVLADVMLGKVDPDTVFFSRRLEITGDTAAAIYFKNILAAL